MVSGGRKGLVIPFFLLTMYLVLHVYDFASQMRDGLEVTGYFFTGVDNS